MQYLLIINHLTRKTARDTLNPQPPDYCVIPDARHQNHVTTTHKMTAKFKRQITSVNQGFGSTPPLKCQSNDIFDIWLILHAIVMC